MPMFLSRNVHSTAFRVVSKSDTTSFWAEQSRTSPRAHPDQWSKSNERRQPATLTDTSTGGWNGAANVGSSAFIVCPRSNSARFAHNGVLGALAGCMLEKELLVESTACSFR